MKTVIARYEVKDWRLALGWSQSQAAQELGVSVRTLQGWEAGRLPLHPTVLTLAMERLADARRGAKEPT